LRFLGDADPWQTGGMVVFNSWGGVRGGYRPSRYAPPVTQPERESEPPPARPKRTEAEWSEIQERERDYRNRGMKPGLALATAVSMVLHPRSRAWGRSMLAKRGSKARWSKRKNPSLTTGADVTSVRADARAEAQAGPVAKDSAPAAADGWAALKATLRVLREAERRSRR
jgi:hypothetical protein